MMVIYESNCPLSEVKLSNAGGWEQIQTVVAMLDVECHVL